MKLTDWAFCTVFGLFWACVSVVLAGISRFSRVPGELPDAKWLFASALFGLLIMWIGGRRLTKETRRAHRCDEVPRFCPWCGACAVCGRRDSTSAAEPKGSPAPERAHETRHPRVPTLRPPEFRVNPDDPEITILREPKSPR